jgi:hypothetical protein
MDFLRKALIEICSLLINVIHQKQGISLYEWAVVSACTEVKGGCNCDQVLLLHAILLPHPVSAKLIISSLMQ